jgi:hypothetical protein
VERRDRIRDQVGALQRAIVGHDASNTRLLQQATVCRRASIVHSYLT